MLDETTYPGIGKTERRRVIQRWKDEGKPLGLSLKQWAARHAMSRQAKSQKALPVGDAAFNWLQAKKRRG